MSNRTKALQFSPGTRAKIKERDVRCIFCKLGICLDGALSVDLVGLQCMHVVNKSQGGLGVVQNGALGCPWHHTLMDNGSHPELREIAENYLKSLYPGWTRGSVTYNKYKDLVVYRK